MVRLYRKKTIIKGRGRYAGKRPHSACIEDGSLGPFGPRLRYLINKPVYVAVCTENNQFIVCFKGIISARQGMKGVIVFNR